MRLALTILSTVMAGAAGYGFVTVLLKVIRAKRELEGHRDGYEARERAAKSLFNPNPDDRYERRPHNG